MKRLLSTLSILGLVSAATVGAAGAKEFTAKMSGKEVVPAVETKATGEATFTPDKDGMKYRITSQGVENATGIHVHLGKPGKDGPPVAMILHSPKQGPLPALEGTIGKDDLAGRLKGKKIDALVAEMEKGNTYINVHTEKNPKGEIRGQIR